MALELLNEKVNNAEYYSVGYSPALREYVLVFVVTGVAWYNRYYKLNPVEYDLFDTHRDWLDIIARDCGRGGINSFRFLFSEKLSENVTDEAKAYCEKAREEAQEKAQEP